MPEVTLTYNDFLTFPDDGKRHELIAGAHYVTPSPNTRHQMISGNLMTALRVCLESHPRGLVFAAPFDVVLSDADVVVPDLIYISRERRRILTAQNVQGAPDLIVEILSPGTRKADEIAKRALYERSGVTDYWIVDPELEVVRIYKRVDAAFVRTAELAVARSDVLTTPLLPELSIPLAQIFAEPS